MIRMMQLGLAFGCVLAIVACSDSEPTPGNQNSAGAGGEATAGKGGRSGGVGGVGGTAVSDAGNGGTPAAGGSGDSAAGDTSAAGVPGDGAAGMGGATGACNDLALPAVVTKTADPAPLPAFTGGTIADGLYHVTSIVTYGTTTPGGTTVQEAYRFNNGAVESAIQSSEAALTLYAGTYATKNSKVTVDITCPGPFKIAIQYTVNAAGIALQHGSDPNEVAYLVKQ